jgi:NADPH:quinone reductase
MGANARMTLYTDKEPSRIPVVWEELLRWVASMYYAHVVTDWSTYTSLFSSGKVKPVTYSTVYPLANAMDGLGALERRETWGKAVVRIRDEEGGKTVAKL